MFGNARIPKSLMSRGILAMDRLGIYGILGLKFSTAYILYAFIK